MIREEFGRSGGESHLAGAEGEHLAELDVLESEERRAGDFGLDVARRDDRLLQRHLRGRRVRYARHGRRVADREHPIQPAHLKESASSDLPLSLSLDSW